MFVFLLALMLFIGCQGPQGIPGEQGLPGPKGEPGIQGEPGQSSLIQWIDPCDHIPATHPELLALIDGAYYAVYASGQHIFFTRLQLHTVYQTTDIRQCTFELDENGIKP